jgi:hypothetical protein
MKGFKWLDKSTWNNFRATIDCHEQSKSSKITIQQTVELLKKFQRFWAQQHPKSCHSEIICFGFYMSSSNFSRLAFNRPEKPATSSSPHPTYYLWYDKNKKCFDAITCLSNFYEDTASYWEYLKWRAGICLDQFFQQEFVALCDEALEVRLVQFSDEVTSFGKTFGSFKRQFDEWKIGNEFDHVVLDMDSCIRSPDKKSKNSASAWCEQLWQVTASCLVRQMEQGFIDRKRKIEMNCIERNIEIDKIRENVERLNWELGKARQRKSELDRRVSDESQQLEELVWNQLLRDLANPGFVPDYHLAYERQNHEIYQEKNASQLAVKVFNLIHPPTTNKEKRAALEKYVKNQSNKKQVLEKLHSALDNFVGREISKEASVVLTKVAEKVASSVKLDKVWKIGIYAKRVIYVDCDWEVPGISVSLVAPLIRVVSSPGSKSRTITTSGRDGKEHESLKAADGNGAGENGSHGLRGRHGEHAGHVMIDCESFTGHLKIVARGGKGADGQDGGDGQPGHKGSDGADGTFPSNYAEGYTWYYFDRKFLYENKGRPGNPGGNGGSGGNSGKGGLGGQGGLVEITVSQSDVTNLFERDCEKGKTGKNGNPGRGAPGGSGGKHGQDAFLYFEPDKWSSIVNTGQWRRHKGSRTNLEKVCLANRIIGYSNKFGFPRIWISSMRYAAAGKRGNEGQISEADDVPQRNHPFNAFADETASQFYSHRHKTRKQDDGDLEWESKLEAIRSAERQQAEEAESIDRMSRDMVGEQNAISRHEKVLASDLKRLRRLKRIRLRVRSKILEIFEQCVVQQSVVGQTITRQIKLNFKDDDDFVLASSVSRDSGRDVRSGRLVSEKSTVTQRCLVKFHELVNLIKFFKSKAIKRIY